MPFIPGGGRELTDEDRQEVAGQITGGFSGLVDTFSDLLFDRPAFVADDFSATPLDAAVKAVTRLNCRLWAASDKTNYSAAVNAGNADICGPYLDSLGENPTDGAIQPEIPNGQCPLQYRVDVALRRVQDGATNSGFVNVYGPIGGTYADRSDGAGGRRIGFEARTSAGVAYEQDVLGYPSTDNWVFTSITATPFPGNPDNCGAPPSRVYPPSTVTPSTPIPPSVTVNIPGIGPLTVDVTLGSDGRPTVCIDELDYCVTLPFGPQSPALPPAGPAPGDQGEPGSPVGTGEGGEAEGEAPPGSVLVGLKMGLLDAPDANEVAPGVYRGGAYIYMGGDGGLDQDFAGSLLTNNQFVTAEKDNLTKWRVSANVGFNWNVTPYYREVE